MPLTSLEGKVALITGSTRGLGRTTADWLAKAGASIIVTGRGDREVASAVAEVRGHGVEAWGIPADLSQVAEAHRLATEALNQVEKIDILVNNAGMSIRSNFWDVSDADWETQVNINYRSPFILAQHISKHMIDHEIQGRIINFSSIGARHCHTNAAVYDSAKGAVETMTRNLAYELGSYGITVNCVVPGAISERPGAVNSDPQGRKTYERHIPSGRVGRAEDIAAAVLFFASPESGYTTGQSLLIDGGHSSYLPESQKGFAF
jgi:NAD(P)-dependent dehydrogenase (short-subunit alcohol dehydrogenase family)